MGKHIAEFFAKKLIEVLAKYGLNSDKVISTVTDSGSNFVKAFEDFAEAPKYGNLSYKIKIPTCNIFLTLNLNVHFLNYF